jgi:DNA-binding Xre family transcriptional regulator
MIVKCLQFKIDDSKEWEVCMAVSYNKLWKLMIDKKVNKTDLTHMAGISTNAMAKLGRDEDVRVNILEKICLALNCKLDDIVEIVPDSGAVEE